ncbi:MAG: indole-3-glycerol-phosphate synthase TrpC, partial [Candidatus Eremiobacteraeota bacterium]|nr:indole-3-glycerol-phosphate synthase TrpC [Candidatus Eremiobacteraeota bacterium]
MSDVLARIFAAKMRAGRADEIREPLEAVHERGLARKGDRRPFAAALHASRGPAIVGEIKRASPSVGLISNDFQPAQIALSYDRAGVDAISVLTESEHFLGELRFLDIARAQTARPLLRKDFLSTPYDVAQSAAYGADAILLIVAGIGDEALHANMAAAKTYDLDVLVEIHNEG